MTEQPEELIINGINIYEELCSNDIRNPHSSIPWMLEDGFYDDEDPPPAPRGDCYCDNCFQGCDRLAMIIIELHETNTDLKSEVEYLEIYTDL